jgi:hypothetical protein
MESPDMAPQEFEADIISEGENGADVRRREGT